MHLLTPFTARGAMAANALVKLVSTLAGRRKPLLYLKNSD